MAAVGVKGLTLVISVSLAFISSYFQTFSPTSSDDQQSQHVLLRPWTPFKFTTKQLPLVSPTVYTVQGL